MGLPTTTPTLRTDPAQTHTVGAFALLPAAATSPHPHLVKIIIQAFQLKAVRFPTGWPPGQFRGPREGWLAHTQACHLSMPPAPTGALLKAPDWWDQVLHRTSI